MWDSFNTYGQSSQKSFETLCNQLFERYLNRTYNKDLIEFKVINGDGGDGGIEAYGKLLNGKIIAVQSKWFKQALDTSEIKQIRSSITTALGLRPNILEYIICIPHNVSSIRIGRGKKPTTNSEDVRIKSFEEEIKKAYPNLKIKWWCEHDILKELQSSDNEGINKYWFEKEIIYSDYLKEKFELQKTNYWLKERYVGDLHTKGDIQNLINRQLNNSSFRKILIGKILELKTGINKTYTILQKFIQVSLDETIINRLTIINNYLENLISEATLLETKLLNGVDINHIINNNEELSILNNLEDAIEALNSKKPSDLQKPYYSTLKISLRELNDTIISTFLQIENELCLIYTSLVLGKPGTGKTLGLAYAIEDCINNSIPAILIQAKGANSIGWTQLLSQELGLSNWNKNEIFSSLEAMAMRRDSELASNGLLGFENTKVLICIDGLDEDILNEINWFDRINETIEITKKYKRIRFVFSAREYFYNNQKLPLSNVNFKELRLKREGDVKLEDVANRYFLAYNITIQNHEIIKGLDSLFALKLFCESYTGLTIKDSDVVQTAISELINLKVEKINTEFLNSLKNTKPKAKRPVFDFLNIISDLFYNSSEVSHNQILDLEIENKIKYLDNNEIELLIEFLANNGIIIKYERDTSSSSMLKTKECFYTFSYQSILETIVSSKIGSLIINNEIDSLPQSIFKPIPLPDELDNNSYYDFIPNYKIIQNIINDVFIKENKLIGFDDFLIEGFTEDDILQLQLGALYIAPNTISSKYKDWIIKIFNEDYIKRFKILQDLIMPLAHVRDSAFNAMFLHDILSNIPTVFERDKFWSGLDSTEKAIVSQKINSKGYILLDEWSMKNILDDNFDLDNTDMFDGLPLIYSWGLTTIDQKLREKIRVKLTKWAIIQPYEFKNLLELMVPINDPQINEDLASITLGFATKSKDKNAILEIALWSLKFIFNDTDKYRNVIVRYGFRSIVERAFQFNLINDKEVEKARPIKKDNFVCLEVDEEYINNPKEEFYPIGHDLSWYVIKEAYDDFLSIEKKNPFISDFFDKYNAALKKSTSARTWVMSTGISYIKSLGFNRLKGSVYTDASHGSKSKIFTYEEKYVWLAVHYLKGYLSDYLPYKYENKRDIWIDDYSKIVHINNPIDDIQIEPESEFDEYFNPQLWVIKEELSPEIDNSNDIQSEINKIVTDEPKVNFKNWLNFNNSDFNLEDKNDYLAIYQYTGLKNSSETITSSIECCAYLIEENDFEIFLNEMKRDSRSISISDYGYPDTDTYTNPSNLFWMDWVEESNNTFEFEENKSVFNCLTRVMKNNVDGEEEVIIPSKKIRKLLEISDLDDNSYYNFENNRIGFEHEVNNKAFSYADNQEIVLIDKELLKKVLKANKLKIFWLASHFIKKNPLNKKIESLKYIDKFRKYIVWEEEENEFKKYKYSERKN